MSASLQNVYAKYLLECHASYGYPLRVPQPMSRLPEQYQEQGLQIGDVGFVENNGQFHVLFNLCKRKENQVHDRYGVPENFEPVTFRNDDVNVIPNAISNGPLHSHGIHLVPKPEERSPNPAEYEFNTLTAAGALLILPCGATSTELSLSEQFRKAAVNSALDWYEFAKKCNDGQRLDRPLYLITGFYKTCSWSLASFDNRDRKDVKLEGKILAQRDNINHDIYRLRGSLSPNCSHGPSHQDNRNLNNQTLFISGFRITLPTLFLDPGVQEVTAPETFWSILVRLVNTCLKRCKIRGFSSGHKPPERINVERSPQLSQPLHPSDTINRFLLSKDPNAKVAITHDSEWIHMISKEGLPHQDLFQEDNLGRFLTQYYTIETESDNAAVFLQRKAVTPMDPASSPPDRTPELETSDSFESSSSDLEESPPPTPEVSPTTMPEFEVSSPTPSELEFSPFACSVKNPQIVITRIRAQNIPFGRKRMPVGSYVSVQFDGARLRTQNKPTRLNDGDIEWEDLIFVPTILSAKIQFKIYASFELDPILGHGEILYESETSVEELVGGTYLITFPSEELETAPRLIPSLLITLGRWYSNPLAVASSIDARNPDSEEIPDLVHETNLGQEALLRYHYEYEGKDLENAMHHFECARRCSSNHPYHAAALVNLAKAKFIRSRNNLTCADLDTVVLLYAEALALRPNPHPDRPATLIHIAQTLLFRYEMQGFAESIAHEINKYLVEFRDLPEDTHEHRAANLVLDTLGRRRVVNSGSLAELDELIPKLKRNVKVHPDGYFDRPQRLLNLSTTLWRRYEMRGNPSDLDESLVMNEQALQLLPSRHPDRLPCLKILSAIFWRLVKAREDPSLQLGRLTALNEEALQLSPVGHPDRPYWVASSKRHLAETSERAGDAGVKAQEYEEAIVQYSRAIISWSELAGEGASLNSVHL